MNNVVRIQAIAIGARGVDVGIDNISPDLDRAAGARAVANGVTDGPMVVMVPWR